MTHILVTRLLVFFLPIFTQGARLLTQSSQPTPEQQLALDITNRYRNLHEDTDALTYGPLYIEQEFTQRWANELKYSSTLRHSGFPNLGENIAFVYGASLPQALDTAFKMFYDDEIINWDFERSQPVSNGVVTGHFTQIVWRNSIQMTFAYAYDPDKQRFAFVFNFMPPGNFIGNYAFNVGRLKKTLPPQKQQLPSLPPPSPSPPQMPVYYSAPYVPYVPFAPYIPADAIAAPSPIASPPNVPPPTPLNQEPDMSDEYLYVPPISDYDYYTTTSNCFKCCKCMTNTKDDSSVYCSITIGQF